MDISPFPLYVLNIRILRLNSHGGLSGYVHMNALYPSKYLPLSTTASDDPAHIHHTQGGREARPKKYRTRGTAAIAPDSDRSRARILWWLSSASRPRPSSPPRHRAPRRTY